MIEINLLREEKGGNPELVRESQRRRHKPVEIVDKVIELDKEWRTLRYRADNYNKTANLINRTVLRDKIKAKEPEGDDLPVPDALLAKLHDIEESELRQLSIKQLKNLSGICKTEAENADKSVTAKENERNTLLCTIGNIVHQDVVVSDNEDKNEIVRTWGTQRKEEGLFNHVDLMIALGFMDTQAGTEVAGNRGYFLKGAGVLLKMALENYAMRMLVQANYEPIYPPFFMTRTVMSEVAQLEQFDEELYKVTGEGEDKYLIATSEQPMAALHRGQWLDDKQLPMKYGGISTCFRKEAGSHGRDTLGIFRVHQFEKVEQFVYCSPKGDESWRMFESMIDTAEKFYQTLGIPYQVVSIVAGALNNAAAMKYDLEGWFPASSKFRELVSCSNCTDYQARRLGIRYGAVKNESDDKEYVHMLNSTMCALTRVLCVILETYQTDKGVRIPDVLVPYMGGIDFLEFVKKPVRGDAAPAQAPAAAPKSKAAPGPVDPELQAEIDKQAALVRKLKDEKADKAVLEPEIQKLVALKSKVGGEPKKEEKPKEEKKGKKEEKPKETKKDKKEDKKDKKGAKSEEPKTEGGYDPKLLAKVAKEGGKKGQDVVGVYEMGGLEFFCTSVDTPDGDLHLCNIVLENMNLEVDPNSEERRGGAAPVGKMIFSAGAAQLAVVARVPEDKISKVNTKEWMEFVLARIGGNIVGEATAEYAQGVALADPSKNRFSIKMKDEAISAGVEFLKSKGCFPQNDDDDDDMVFGDDDFDI